MVHDDATLFGHRTVTEASVETFGCLTGDYSRIHFDHAFGAAAPDGRGFAHGLLSASWALGALTRDAPHRVGFGDPQACVSGFDVRFDDVVRFGDTLAFRSGDPAAGDALADSPAGRRTRDLAFTTNSAFTCVAADGRTVTRGTVALEVPREGAPPGPWPAGRGTAALFPGGHFALDATREEWRAEDLLEAGPQGGAPVRTVTEADVVGYANFTGELNPLYLDREFAERSLFGARIAPPMLCFCLGFSVWLRELLRLPMGGDESTAGHLGDRWRLVAPVHLGDTLEVRYRTLAVRRTRSRPERGVVTFGLQLLNQREELVQQGEVDMMLPMRNAS